MDDAPVDMSSRIDLAQFTMPGAGAEFDLTLGNKGQLVAKEVRMTCTSVVHAPAGMRKTPVRFAGARECN